MTGREVLLRVAGMDGEKIADALQAIGYVCVPREPTRKMLDEAWAYAPLDEDAGSVWREMIAASEAKEAESQ